MYRSRMPYTRWHAKGELLKEQLKEAMQERYARLHKNISISESSETTESDRTPRLLTSEDKKFARIKSDEFSDDERKVVVKAIREQQKEFQRANRRLGFGIQCERFKKEPKEYVPPPGTYTQKISSLNIAPKSESREDEPFTKASPLKRLIVVQPSFVGPGVYEPQHYLDRNTAVKTKGRFDMSTEVRCGRIKFGYLSTLNPPQNGPRFTDFPTSIDLLESRDNRWKGKFLSCERFPKKKIGLQIAPNKYDPNNPFENPRSFNVKQVPFLKSTGRMTEKQYQAFIGNVTPYTGPGRYNLPPQSDVEPKGHQFAKESLDILRGPERTHILTQRLQPRNIPKGWASNPLNKDRHNSQYIGQHIRLR